MEDTKYRGSEWRKWDLHIHLPGTKLSDGYTASEDENVLDKFCDALDKSDVEVFGITDYFSADKFFEFTDRYYEKFPDSNKVFFPNVELRLNESVNPAQEEVNIHLIFPPEIEAAKAQEFLGALKTEITNANDRKIKCSELSTIEQFKSATVTREEILEAIEHTFGKNIIRQDHVMILTAANNDGLRPRRGASRKENISDQIDKFSDAYFGSARNTDYFLNQTRLEDPQQLAKKKPVFAACDAHNFEDLENWLGRQVDEEGAKKEVTWIKSNPTYEGLLQTLIEPSERVKVQPTKPDEKEPYKYISKVKFSDTSDFPAEIVFNSNLCSIIGSRSSGKSALLAYIAHAINSEDTIKRQMDAQEVSAPEKVGPAAGKTWSSVSDIECTVEWGIGESEEGRVIFIPQNYLYSISKRPSEITKKIQPVLFANYPAISAQYDKTTSDVTSSNETIREATNEWFSSDDSINKIREEISNLGDKKAVEAAKSAYKAQIDELKRNLSLNQEDIDKFQQVAEQISQKKSRISEIDDEQNQIAPFYNDPQQASSINLQSTISFYPSVTSLPAKLVGTISEAVVGAEEKITEGVKTRIETYRKSLTEESKKLNEEIAAIIASNKALIEKNQRNQQLAKLVDSFNRQSSILTAIDNKEAKIKELEDNKKTLVEKINGAVLARSQAFLALSQIFSGVDQSQTDMTFGVEIDFNPEIVEELSEKFDRRENSPYLDAQKVVMIGKLRKEVGTFLSYLNTTQKFKQNHLKKQVAIAALCTTEEVRFNATLEGDKIGGFTPSSMTPGKQALFALTLILDESDDAWPLLIDQPEDDLDSRSIYDYIVPYLMQSKRERQILMVSHNANLVIGADSEQLIVANRHGIDRKNAGNRLFDYLTGAIEDTKDKDTNPVILASCGIREHAIEILDGGKEAFEKRKDKYKI